MTKLQELREAIIALNPKKGGRAFKNGPVDLAMTLVALGDTTSGFVSSESVTIFYIEGFIEWDLTKDLDSQSEETILALSVLINGEAKNEK